MAEKEDESQRDSQSKSKKKRKEFILISNEGHEYLLKIQLENKSLIFSLWEKTLDTIENAIFESSYKFLELTFIDRRLRGFTRLEDIYGQFSYAIQNNLYELSKLENDELLLKLKFFKDGTNIYIRRKLKEKVQEEKKERLEQVQIKDNFLSSLKLSIIKKSHKGYISCACLTSDGRLASGSQDKTIKIYSLSTYRCERTIKEHKGPINSICLLDSKYLLSSSDDKTVKIFDLFCGLSACRKTLQPHEASVVEAIPLKNKRICSSSAEGKLKIWKNLENDDRNLDEFKYICIKSIDTGSMYLKNILEARNLNYIITRKRCSLVFWDSLSYDLVTEYHLDTMCFVDFHMDEIPQNRLIIGGQEAINIFNMLTLQIETSIILKKNLGMPSCFFSLGEDNVLCGTTFGDFIHFNLSEAKVINVKERAHHWSVERVILFDNSTLITCSLNSIKIWK